MSNEYKYFLHKQSRHVFTYLYTFREVKFPWGWNDNQGDSKTGKAHDLQMAKYPTCFPKYCQELSLNIIPGVKPTNHQVCFTPQKRRKTHVMYSPISEPKF